MKTKITEMLAGISGSALRGGGLVALLLLAMFVSLSPERAQAQSSDTWKSVAIIGGSTAAGAIFGHAVAGRTGAYVGAAVGAGTGYAIDRRRRQNEYNNGYYGNNGYRGNEGGYYGNGPYGNDGYRGGSYADESGYQNTGYYRNDNRCSRR